MDTTDCSTFPDNVVSDEYLSYPPLPLPEEKLWELGGSWIREISMGWISFLSPTDQCQSTEVNMKVRIWQVAWPYTVLDTTRLLKERKPFPLRQFSVDEKDIDEI